MKCSEISTSLQCKKIYKRDSGFVVLILYSYFKVSINLQPRTPFNTRTRRCAFSCFPSPVFIKPYLFIIISFISFPFFFFPFFILSFPQNQQYFLLPFSKSQNHVKKILNDGGAMAPAKHSWTMNWACFVCSRIHMMYGLSIDLSDFKMYGTHVGPYRLM